MPSILIICCCFSGKVSILKKSETENVSQENAEVLKIKQQEIIEAGLKLLMKRYLNLTKFGEVLSGSCFTQ